ncbi:MAG: hypothetical protein HYV15_02340, partial [Elusimicrobia bacterium]|nr:hypothetical protein [Elusimicrobiota bacterium]
LLVPGLVVPGIAASLTPSLALPLPSIPSVAVAPAGAAKAVPAAQARAGAPAEAAAAAAADKDARPLTAALAERVQALADAGGAKAAPAAARAELDRLFSGGAAPANAVAEARTVNDEGIEIFGRPPAYYKEVRRIVDKYKGRLDLSESLDVMDDSYADAWAKLAGVEAVAKSRRVDDHNTHLDGTLLWVDGILRDKGRQIAVNTHRVYFHPAKNPRSEIAEGTRRVNGYIDQALDIFKARGKAEQAFGRLDEVVLVFDSRGYEEIKTALKAREREVAKATKGRIRFAYLDEVAAVPSGVQQTRDALNRLIKRFGRTEGLGKIIEGVVYSRYVGMLLELKTVEYYLEKGWTVLQSGRDFFDADGMYVTELDTVVQDPATGRVTMVEAKSARVPIPPEEALNEKVVRKLEVYQKHRARLEAGIGRAIDEVVFSFDVGQNAALAPYLRAREAELSKRYGFTVKFLFLSSSPSESRGRLVK